MRQPQKRPRRQIAANALVVLLAIFAERAGISPQQLRRFAEEGMPVLRLDRIEPALAWLRACSALTPTPTEELSQLKVG